MFVETLGAPAENAAVVTPSDTVNLGVLTRGILVGVAGNISVEMMGTGTAGGSSHTCVIPVSAGIVYPIRVSRVNSANTTATGLVALWQFAMNSISIGISIGSQSGGPTGGGGGPPNISTEDASDLLTEDSSNITTEG